MSTCPDIGTVDLGALMGDLEIPISSEGYAQMIASLTEGYEQYIQSNPNTAYQELQMVSRTI